ncbi:MAG: wax ester/triacylglycerol synthase family O-acyltransferase [Nocardiaceae bacterium]|nr:wax ester/triacylglycerol synthase family O-acyltransferase [Nocardiaceae bacterium]
MVSRLTLQDASFLLHETATVPMHIGSLAIVDNSSGELTYDRLIEIVERRLALVPRYRQKVRTVPLSLSRPVWVDDRDFDLTYHIRRSALPSPGTDDQLYDLVSRLSSQRLDRSRPLWEMYLIEGLSSDRLAIYTKSHSGLVDGEVSLDIGHVILDTSRSPRAIADDQWHPDREPSGVGLAVGALAEIALRPGLGNVLVKRAAEEVGKSVKSTLKDLAKPIANFSTVTRSVPTSPLNVPNSLHRRFAVVKTPLSDYRRIRECFECTINDVILAVVAGALRNWMYSRGELLTASTTLRGLVPMSVYVGDSAESGPSEVSSFLIDLPVGESNPVIRLSHIAHATRNGNRRKPVRARTLVRLAGFAPASLHAMSVRAAVGFEPGAFNVMITNAPGPQVPMYVGGAQMVDMFPVSPLLRDQALSIGMTSYDGSVYYGLNADRDAMPDIEVLRSLLRESLEELLRVCDER